MMALDAFPDPVLTANIYCERQQDHFLSRALPPFWREVRCQDLAGNGYLWFVRYGRGGEHVKLRVHAPGDRREQIAVLLDAAVEDFFTGSALPELAKRKDWSTLPPIDPEDETAQDHPDRSLLWTTYRRSHVNLGGQPFLDDDLFVALVTRCLGEGSEIVLSTLTLDELGRIPHSQRQTTLLKLLLAGLPALCPDRDDRTDYLAYHRDWLVRFSLSRRNADLEKAGETVRYFDEQVAVSAADGVDRLRKVVARQWAFGAAEDAEMRGWCAALSALVGYVGPLATQPGYRLDPYASNPAFAVFFKVLHGMANQIGLTMMNEAYSHHLLRASALGQGAT